MLFVVDFPFLFLLPFKSLLSSCPNISLKDLVLQILLHFFDPVVFYMNFRPIFRLRHNFQRPSIFLLLKFKKFLSFLINLMHQKFLPLTLFPFSLLNIFFMCPLPLLLSFLFVDDVESLGRIVLCLEAVLGFAVLADNIGMGVTIHV